MCVMSMVMDHYWDKWQPQPVAPYLPPTSVQIIPIPIITQAEVDEFRQLLQRAREYDKLHNQPNCELEEKKDRVRQLAKELGLDVSFIDAP